jgi:hypothetical protein
MNPMSHAIAARRGRRWLPLGAAVTAAALWWASPASGWGASHADAASAVVDTGGTTLSHRGAGTTGALGVTFGFEDRTIKGGPYDNQGNQIYNLPMYDAAKSSAADFWLSSVEQLVAAGVDYVAVDTRGYIPGSAVPNQGGDPRALTDLVAAINKAGAAGKLKIAAFDDIPASMTDKKNQVKHHSGGYSPPFDMGDTTGAGEGGYQYLWDNDLKAFYQAVPDSMLYKVNGQPLVYLWSDNSFAFSNQGNGNSARLLSYVRGQAQAQFKENPYFVVDQSWVKNDPAVSSVANGQDGWFGVPSPTYTNMTLNGTTTGATVPSFHFVNGSSNMVIDPAHGQTFANDLLNTVGKNDALTLVEGFTDWPENAALWRTENAPYATTQRDYPGQDINILRRYSRTPFPATTTVQAETADSVGDSTPTNTLGVYRDDALDVQTTSDTGGGWNVGAIATGEWEQWNEVPMQGTQNLKVRVASPLTGAQVRFVVDGVAGPTVNVPTTGGWQTWQTVDAGTFQFNAGSYHTVRLEYLKGGLNVNDWQAVAP